MLKKPKPVKKTAKKPPPHPRNRYEALSHVSGLLWHFLGPKDDHTGYSTILDRMVKKVNDTGTGGELRRWLPAKDDFFYKRKLMFDEGGFGFVVDPNDKRYQTFWVKEHRALCFCDIPINHLPLHMEKYGDVGFGFRRDKLFLKASDLQPVRYFRLKSSVDLVKYQNRFWKFDDGLKEVELDEYIKIPTLLSKDIPVLDDDESELFDRIYEEREWRSIDGFEYTLEELAFVLIPDRVYLKKYPKLQKLVENGVGLIVATDLYALKEVAT